MGALLSCITVQQKLKCSKFYVENKALEKMGRMEDATSIMMDRFNNLYENVEHTLTTMMEYFHAMRLRVLRYSRKLQTETRW